MTLEELAERCEGATGADRSIDVAIIETHGWQHRQKGWFLIEEWWERGCERLYASQIPKFTASLDAAMSLVPDGYNFALSRTRGKIGAHVGVGPGRYAQGFTPALALCASALRAKEQSAKVTTFVKTG